jgi:hypothetical protein
MNRIVLCLSILALFGCVAKAHESMAPRTLIVKTGRILDAKSETHLDRAANLIEGDRVKELGQPSEVQAHAPAGTAQI